MYHDYLVRNYGSIQLDVCHRPISTLINGCVPRRGWLGLGL
jgi:hypothetical protein